MTSQILSDTLRSNTPAIAALKKTDGLPDH